MAMGDFFKDHNFAGHAVAACGAITLSASLTQPIDTLKTLLQVLYNNTFPPFCFSLFSLNFWSF